MNRRARGNVEVVAHRPVDASHAAVRARQAVAQAGHRDGGEDSGVVRLRRGEAPARLSEALATDEPLGEQSVTSSIEASVSTVPVGRLLPRRRAGSLGGS